jgi:hypothetical protein
MESLASRAAPGAARGAHLAPGRGARALRARLPAPPRRAVLDSPPERAPTADDDVCCSSAGRRRAGAPGDAVLASRAALERLYAAPLAWGGGLLPLVAVEAAPGAPGGGGTGAAAAPPPPPPLLVLAAAPQQQNRSSPPDQREKSPDYYANVGDAIRTLREDIPLLFERDLNCACGARAACGHGARAR